MEFIDFSFHYTDTANELALTGMVLPTAGGYGWGAPLTQPGTTSIWAIFHTLLWGFLYIYMDVALFILQALIGVFKLFIAFFLL